MAFNPFNAFRKHQKVVFAALTIVCMLTFVMAGGSFAGGDFFSELTRWVTGRKGSQEVATVYGRRVSDRELYELRRQRRLANEFMQQALLQAQENIYNEVQNILAQLDQADQNQLQQILMRKRFAAFSPGEYLNNLRIFLLQLQIMERRLEAANKPAEQLNALSRLRAALHWDFWLFHSPKDDLYSEDNNLYFGGSTSEKGLLDFLIWRHQAERLGIALTEGDIGEQYKHETLNRAGSSSQILRQIGLQADTATVHALLVALGDEFRVRMAQAALVGYDPAASFSQVPTSITPYEFWQYYRTNRTELSLQLLPLPVSKFVPDEKPSEAELEALFQKYKDQEYAPDKDTPGFKQPRRLKIEWVSASADSEYYRKQAQQWLLSLVAATPSNPILPLALLEPLVNEYETLKWGHFRASPLTAADFAASLYDYAYLDRAENVAATVGQVLGTTALQGNGLVSTLAAYQSAAIARTQKDLAPIIAHEAQRRLPLSGAAFATGTSLQPALALAGVWHYAGKIDQYLPLEEVKGELVRKFRETVANRLLSSSLDAFKKELEAVRKELETKKIKHPDAEKRIEKAVRDYGWTHGATKDLQDPFEINRDTKELAPLKEAYMKNAQFRDPKGKLFAQNLLFSQPADRWKLFTPQELSSGLSPDSSEKKTFLYWKTDDQPAKVLTFAQARSQVESAWRLEKARALAKAKADELAKQARDTHGNYLPILTEASKQYSPVFDLHSVALWVKPPLSSRADPSAQYVPYTVPDDKIEYPPAWPTIVEQLLENLHESGDTMVITNRPRDVYYVVALARRDAPSMQDFYKDTPGNLRLLLGQLEVEHEKEYRKAFLKQLQLEANLTINEEGLQRVKERPNLREE